eukprot:1764783-Rhodomonas_salina.1
MLPRASIILSDRKARQIHGRRSKAEQRTSHWYRNGSMKWRWVKRTVGAVPPRAPPSHVPPRNSNASHARQHSRRAHAMFAVQHMPHAPCFCIARDQRPQGDTATLHFGSGRITVVFPPLFVVVQTRTASGWCPASEPSSPSAPGTSARTPGPLGTQATTFTVQKLPSAKVKTGQQRTFSAFFGEPGSGALKPERVLLYLEFGDPGEPGPGPSWLSSRRGREGDSEHGLIDAARRMDAYDSPLCGRAIDAYDAPLFGRAAGGVFVAFELDAEAALCGLRNFS